MPTSITVVMPDGSSWTATSFSATTVPVVTEVTDTGLVVTHSDGSTQSFVPAS